MAFWKCAWITMGSAAAGYLFTRSIYDEKYSFTELLKSYKNENNTPFLTSIHSKSLYENGLTLAELRPANSIDFDNQISTTYFDRLPREKWVKNWDEREPINLIENGTNLNEDQKQEMLAKFTPKATRNIFLIRHGQYQMDSKPKILTPLGREQATLLGKRLAESKFKFDKLTMSTMPRAMETAELILAELPPIPSTTDTILEEGAPYPPEPPNAFSAKYKYFSEGSRIEAAFRKYIHRASVKQTKNSFEIIVCHANVIRYFVCRALQFPPEGWLRMSLGNCSITWIIITPSGHVHLRLLGDIGHLPSDKVSFS
ncbi:unnamed protein product [Dracunculus medinensis]|uniref:Serine/threonine-protein phosphatase PGAM5, mitochondrial n=1 Tax=Dracunculus medinensis TaxID=318479 RepID=A0A0N4UFQ0_DRAME|nr:unnamed protein product [Dracunculus medinensis]